MEGFDHLFTSHFVDAERSLGNTLGGFVDHAIRLAGHAVVKGPLAPLFATALADTQALSLRAQQAQQALGLSLGTQKQATDQTTTAQTTALARIRKNEGTLKGDALIEDDHERERLYALLYPSGLKYYTTARLGTELPDRLAEYLTRVETEEASLGPAFVTRTREALGPFRKTRETQVTGLGSTANARDDRHALVAELDQQCDFNYHLLSLVHRAELGRPAASWNPAYYLRGPGTPAAPAPVVPAPHA